LLIGDPALDLLLGPREHEVWTDLLQGRKACPSHSIGDPVLLLGHPHSARSSARYKALLLTTFVFKAYQRAKLGRAGPNSLLEACRHHCLARFQKSENLGKMQLGTVVRLKSPSTGGEKRWLPSSL